MRILVISNLFPPVVRGGYELVCGGVVERLRARHDVHVLTTDLDRDEAPASEHVSRDLPYVTPGKRAVLRGPLDAAVSARHTRRVLEKIRPDVIYVWGMSFVSDAALRVCVDSGKPLALHFMDHWLGRLYVRDPFMRYLHPSSGYQRGAWRRLVQVVNRHPVLRLRVGAGQASLSWVSAALRDEVAAPPETISPLFERVIHPASPSGHLFAAAERAPAADRTVVFAGRVSPEKGIDVAYRALAELHSRHGLSARLSVAGRWAPGVRAQMDALAKELGITERVEVLGTLDPQELARVLARADAALIPSVWHEPAPLACVEAALACVPVVASRVGGIPEVLRDGEHALLFSPGNAQECADALARVFRDPVEAEQRARRALERGQELSFDTYASACESLLGDTVAAFGNRPDH
jgi:glycosyltransferase involved in cell wall biosynthesis